MNTMTLPGFSAEVSLYQSSAHYQVSPTSAGLRQGGELLILPAMRPFGFVGCRCTPSWCCCGIGPLVCCCRMSNPEECFCDSDIFESAPSA